MPKKNQRTLLIAGGGVVLAYLLYRWYTSRSTTSSTGGVGTDAASTLQGQQARDYASLAGQEQSDVAALQSMMQQYVQQLQDSIDAQQPRHIFHRLLKEMTATEKQALHELAAEKRLERKLRAEIKKVMSGEKSGRHERHQTRDYTGHKPHIPVPNPHLNHHQSGANGNGNVGAHVRHVTHDQKRARRRVPVPHH